MRRYWIAALLSVCLAVCGLPGKAWAEEGTYRVDGTFCYRDVDGVLKPIPYGWMTLGYRENESDQETEHSGDVRDGIFMIPESFDTKRPGIYTVRVSCYGPNQTVPVSCGSDTIAIRVAEQGASFGEVELTLHMNIQIVVYDADHQQLGEFDWSLWRNQNRVDGGTAKAVGSSLWDAAPWLRLDWARYQLRLEKEGYQTAVYDLCPVMDADGNVSFENGLDPTALRLVPEGKIVQPTPTDLSFSGGVLRWRPTFVGAEDSERDPYMRFCQLEFTNCSSQETNVCSTSCAHGRFTGWDLFDSEPTWESGWYTVKIRALAGPYRETTVDSEPAFLRFYYEKPKGYLPDVQGPSWSEDAFPAMTWGYDPDFLKCVEEFYIIPRVADAENGIPWDFAHEFLGDRWKGAFGVAPSPGGVYEVPELMEAIRAYGEGWYFFEVGVTSGVEEWRGGQNWTDCENLYHYVPDPVRNGTMVSASSSGTGKVKWTLDNRSRKLEVKSAPSAGEQLFVASYDENGRFQGVKAVQQGAEVDLSRAGSARMFWTGGTFAPLSRASDIISAAG